MYGDKVSFEPEHVQPGEEYTVWLSPVHTRASYSWLYWSLIAVRGHDDEFRVDDLTRVLIEKSPDLERLAEQLIIAKSLCLQVASQVDDEGSRFTSELATFYDELMQRECYQVVDASHPVTMSDGQVVPVDEMLYEVAPFPIEDNLLSCIEQTAEDLFEHAGSRQPGDQPPPRKQSKKRGREPDPEEERIVLAWETGQYRTYLDCAESLELKTRNNVAPQKRVRNAVDAAKRRRRRDKESSDKTTRKRK